MDPGVRRKLECQRLPIGLHDEMEEEPAIDELAVSARLCESSLQWGASGSSLMYVIELTRGADAERQRTVAVRSEMRLVAVKVEGRPLRC